jgi:RHS repeat-associated protein
MGASGSTYAAGTDEPDLYFYHTDHLGSTTYITDRKEVAQYVAYTPYGETFKEYKNVTPYKFNGKELDQETGYYYYGARYYDPGTALWFGTDPLQHKYPEVSPYVYCAGNPVVRIDPDGRWVHIVIGAAVGAVVNGAIVAIEGKSGKQIAAAAIGGAVGGAIASANPDLIVEYGAMAGAAGDIAEQCINIALGEADEYDVGSTVTGAITGGAFNALGNATKKPIQAAGEKSVSAIKKSLSSEQAYKSAVKEIKSEYRQAGKPTHGPATNRQIISEAKSRIADEKVWQVGVSKAKTEMKKAGVDAAFGTANTLSNHKINDLRDE